LNRTLHANLGFFQDIFNHLSASWVVTSHPL
jgi:hypothetical protein